MSSKIFNNVASSLSIVSGVQILSAHEVRDLIRFRLCLVSQKESHLVYKPEKGGFSVDTAGETGVGARDRNIHEW